MSPGVVQAFCLLLLSFWLSACSTLAPPANQNPEQADFWQGRLSMRAQTAGSNADVSVFNAQFELQGSAHSGSLLLLTPLGTALAEITWRRDEAQLISRGEIRRFANVDVLISELLGVDLQVDALFAWLRGQALRPQGWQVDLSQHAKGRISASKPGVPQAMVTLLIENNKPSATP